MYEVLRRPSVTDIMKDFTKFGLKRLSWDGNRTSLYGAADILKDSSEPAPAKKPLGKSVRFMKSNI